MSSTSSQLFAMLLGQLPLILVYLGALIVALIFWGRHPRPALFVFLGAVLLLIVTLTLPVVQTWVMEQRASGGMSVTQVGQRLAVLSMVTQIVRAVGYALLVCAAFVGRGGEIAGAAFPVATAMRTTSPPPPMPRL